MNLEYNEKRCGSDRRFYIYGIHIPEKRCGERRGVVQGDGEGICFCPDCGAPAPVWAAECLACGCVWDD